jgi:hypothetical protein
MSDTREQAQPPRQPQPGQADQLQQSDQPQQSEPSGMWSYVGVGCLSAVIGLAGGGMLGVLVARIVSAVQRCTVEGDPRAPCDWSTYWTWGARIGLLLVPAISIWRLRRARAASRATN